MATMGCLSCQERPQAAICIDHSEATEMREQFFDDMRLAIDGQIASLASRLEEVMRKSTEQVLEELRSKPGTNSQRQLWMDQGDSPNPPAYDTPDPVSDNIDWESAMTPDDVMKVAGTGAYLEQLHQVEYSVTEGDSIEKQEMQDKWFALQLKTLRDKFELEPSAVSAFTKPLQKFITASKYLIPHNRLARFCQGRVFTTACTMLVVCNTLFMGIEADMDMRVALGTAQSAGLTFTIINRCFGCLFFLELAIRIGAFRWYLLLAPDWRWNVFDASLVATIIIQEVLESSNLSFMRIIRVFRVVRVARVVRIVHFFRELRRMVIAISSCFASLCWAGLLLLLIMFIFSIIILEGASIFVREAADDETSTTAKEGIALWYATLGHTMFTLILAITGGMDWWEMLRPLLQVSEIYRYVFAFYVVFVVIGVLNVLTAVFLENATEVKDKDLVVQAQILQSDAFAMEMRDFFHNLDEECNGFIEWERFQEVMNQEEIQAYLATQLLESQDAYTLFKLIDRNNDGRIALEPFVQGCLRLRGHARTMDVAVLLREQAQLRTQLMKLRSLLRKILR